MIEGEIKTELVNLKNQLGLIMDLFQYDELRNYDQGILSLHIEDLYDMLDMLELK